MAPQNEKYNDMLNSFLKHILDGIERVNTQIDRLSEQFQNYRGNVQNTFQEIAQTLAELKIKAGDFDRYRKELEVVSKSVTDLQRQITTIDLNLDDLVRRISLVENQNTDDKKSDDLINRDYVALTAQVSTLKDKVQELETHIKDLNAKGGLGGSVGGSIGGIVTGIIMKFIG
jgi:chromosome segregation ATPase